MLHYTSCGLRNIYLENGYEVHRTAYGQGVAIADVEGLHRAIGMALVRNKPALSGAEFRFLRKELDLSQKQLARYIGIQEQTLSKWERQGRVPRYAERFLRALFREYAEGNAQIRQLVDRLAELDRAEQNRLTFDHTDEGWREAA